MSLSYTNVYHAQHPYTNRILHGLGATRLDNSKQMLHQCLGFASHMRPGCMAGKIMDFPEDMDDPGGCGHQ
ncbi:hypothetical protein CY34DRAFT_797013 [Suillus luteus UH-Slu-Lm8-n1]|uniref:Uncharacterized protein n=1 Tax=Suillus luteus UH-Slu-Lm8-n1 TaxID=930992 RepID=A0A0D0AHK7_9AGAM|nr:hypothetical protein CY34DRAFT_797013 [Suillus luteus UH-Slu-Lm8-n1]